MYYTYAYSDGSGQGSEVAADKYLWDALNHSFHILTVLETGSVSIYSASSVLMFSARIVRGYITQANAGDRNVINLVNDLTDVERAILGEQV